MDKRLLLGYKTAGTFKNYFTVELKELEMEPVERVFVRRVPAHFCMAVQSNAFLFTK